MKTHVEFRSDAFPCYGDIEQGEVNPGRYGKRLAEFLTESLRKEGFAVEEPAAVDWGWVGEIKNKEFPLSIGCGNYDEYDDGFLCFIEPHEPRIRLLRNFFRAIDTTPAVTALTTALDRILAAHPGIKNIRWWTYDEFMHPPAPAPEDAPKGPLTQPLNE